MGHARKADSTEISADLSHGRRVLSLESDALKALAASLDERFAQAVALLHRVEQGRVVVSGMGKSGHVARKIAATLASTGTPAQFVHPAEASHGDMGAIAAEDAVLMLSNSGETRELGDLIGHTRRYRIPLVGIAGQAESTLIQTADVGLVLPPVAEACPMGLAPTTSTTMMLALGDALAVALMERRGFTLEQYRVLHPGGALGRALIRVEDIMHTGTELPLVDCATPMREVLIEMTGKRFGCAGVVDGEGRLVGIITDGDLRRHMADGLLSLTAEAVMTGRPLTIRKSALAAEALGVMNARPSPVTCLFVVGEEAAAGREQERPRPIGIVHMHDCLRAGIR